MINKKDLSGKEPFVTDPIPLRAKAGEWLCYEITLTGSCYPYHEEAVLTMVPDKQIPLPLMIRSDLWKTADGLFDIAAVLGREAPNEHRCIYGGHPNAQGCKAVADAYLKWM